MARTYRATIQAHMVSDGALIMPSFHYQTDVPTGGSEPDPNDVADGIWGHVGASYTGHVLDTAHIDELVVSEQTVPPAIGVAGSHTINVPGLASSYSGDMPRALCPLVNLHTGTRSRSARGWTFLPPITAVAELSSGKWTSAFLTTFGALAALFADSLTLGSLFPTTLNPVVYSRKRHLEGATPYTFKLTSTSINPEPAWLRSRLTAP